MKRNVDPNAWPLSVRRALEIVGEMPEGTARDALVDVVALAALRCVDKDREFEEWVPVGRGN